MGLGIAHLCTQFDDCSFSPSRDMVDAHQNLNGSRDLAHPGMVCVCHSWASTCYDQPITKFEVSVSTRYEDMKGDTKCLEWGS